MFRARRACYERRNTDFPVCEAQRSCTPLFGARKADRMSAWRTGRWPVFLIFAMAAGAAESQARNTDFPVCEPSGVALRCSAQGKRTECPLDAQAGVACVPNFRDGGRSGGIAS